MLWKRIHKKPPRSERQQHRDVFGCQWKSPVESHQWNDWHFHMWQYCYYWTRCWNSYHSLMKKKIKIKLQKKRNILFSRCLPWFYFYILLYFVNIVVYRLYHAFQTQSIKLTKIFWSKSYASSKKETSTFYNDIFYFCLLIKKINCLQNTY